MACKMLILVVLLVGLGGEAQAKVLCQDKTTKALFVRTKCKVSERQVDPVRLGLQGPVAKDANGKTIGVVDGPSVLRSIDGVVVAFRVEAAGFNQDLSLAYQSSDCSGSSFIGVVLSASQTPLAYPGQVLGSTLYYPTILAPSACS